MAPACTVRGLEERHPGNLQLLPDLCPSICFKGRAPSHPAHLRSRTSLYQEACLQACYVTDLQLLHEVLLQVRSLLLKAHVGVALLWCCDWVLRHLLPFRNPLMLLLLLVQRLPVVLLRCCGRPDCLAHIWHPSYPCRMASHLLLLALPLLCKAE